MLIPSFEEFKNILNSLSWWEIDLGFLGGVDNHSYYICQYLMLCSLVGISI